MLQTSGIPNSPVHALPGLLVLPHVDELRGPGLGGGDLAPRRPRHDAARLALDQSEVGTRSRGQLSANHSSPGPRARVRVAARSQRRTCTRPACRGRWCHRAWVFNA